MGHLHDELSLRLTYSAADALIIPSRMDNLPNTGVESLSCGTPVLSFDIGGMRDIVDHLNNGYLARPFDCIDLADGIELVTHINNRDSFSKSSREKAVRCFGFDIVSKMYLEFYKSILSH